MKEDWEFREMKVAAVNPGVSASCVGLLPATIASTPTCARSSFFCKSAFSKRSSMRRK